jgi:hypothetical protein
LALTPGTRLGVYEVTAQIGEGGMGEVYRARDTKLNRDVALKVLPNSFADDPDRLARFTREAQTLAALNHSNIAHIHGLEESGGVRALVMELVDGEDLAQRLVRGPIPVDEALPIARQIADALEAAHEAGIIHRDLKPANIKIRLDGTVKVLDFGLAKALDPAGSAPAVALQNSPTITSQVMSGHGLILGTAAYMAPEQARGRAVDKRADIWAFGVVLYEMLTGERAFKGDGPSDVLAAVLRQEIDWKALPSTTPPSIRRLLERCLDRDPRRRLHDIGDARIEIEDGLKSPAPATGGASGRIGRPGALVGAIVATAIVFGVAGGLAVRNLTPPAAPPPITRFSIGPPPGQVFRGLGRALDISRDGTQLVYATNGGIYLRSMSSVETRQISAGFQIGINPTFSPDGQTVALWWPREKAIKGISASKVGEFTLGSASRDVGSLFGVMNWGPGGIVVGHATAGVFLYPTSGGPPVRIARVADGESAVVPQMLPDGEHVLFTIVTSGSVGPADRGQVVLQSVKTQERRTLIEHGSAARYVPSGHIVYALDGILYALPFDLRRLTATGPPVRVVDGVRQAASSDAQFSISDTGTLVYVPGPASAATPGSRAHRPERCDRAAERAVRRVRGCASLARRQARRLRQRRRQRGDHLGLRCVGIKRCAPAHLRRAQQVSRVVARRRAYRVPVGSRRGRRDLLAAR